MPIQARPSRAARERTCQSPACSASVWTRDCRRRACRVGSPARERSRSGPAAVGGGRAFAPRAEACPPGPSSGSRHGRASRARHHAGLVVAGEPGKERQGAVGGEGGVPGCVDHRVGRGDSLGPGERRPSGAEQGIQPRRREQPAVVAGRAGVGVDPARTATGNGDGQGRTVQGGAERASRPSSRTQHRHPPLEVPPCPRALGQRALLPEGGSAWPSRRESSA